MQSKLVVHLPIIALLLRISDQYQETAAVDLALIIFTRSHGSVATSEIKTGIVDFFVKLADRLDISRTETRMAVVNVYSGTANGRSTPMMKIVRTLKEGQSKRAVVESHYLFGPIQNNGEIYEPAKVIRDVKERIFGSIEKGDRPQIPNMIVVVGLMQGSVDEVSRLAQSFDAYIRFFVSNYESGNATGHLSIARTSTGLQRIRLDEAPGKIDKEIRDRLSQCTVKEIASQCYYDKTKNCFKDQEFKLLKDWNASRYCRNGVGIQECDASECDRECQNSELWSECDCSTNNERKIRNESISRKYVEFCPDMLEGERTCQNPCKSAVVIAVSVIGSGFVFVVVALTVICCYFKWKRSKRHRQSRYDDSLRGSSHSGRENSNHERSRRSPRSLRLPPRDRRGRRRRSK